MEKVGATLKLAASDEGSEAIPEDYVGYLYLYVQASYYKKTGNYALAHMYIDKLLEKESLPDDWRLKAGILTAEEGYPEAIRL